MISTPKFTFPNPSEDIFLLFVHSEDISDAQLKRLWSTLDEEEHHALKGIRSVKAARDFTVGHGILRLLLSRLIGGSPRSFKFFRGSYGKPFLATKNPHRQRLSFNISHSNGVIVMAVAHECDLGADIEHVVAINDVADLAERFFPPKEAERVRQAGYSAACDTFYDTWTVKEAYLKCRGYGLAMPLNAFYVEISDSAAPKITITESVYEDGRSWSVLKFRLDKSYRGALVISQPRHLKLIRAITICTTKTAARASNGAVFLQSHPDFRITMSQVELKKFLKPGRTDLCQA